MAIEKGRKRDEWLITFNLPGKVDGKYVRAPKRTFHGKKRDAKEALERYKAEYLSQLAAENEAREASEAGTVASYAARYHEQKAMKSPLAYKREGLEIRHIARLFPGVALTALDAKAIRLAYSKERARRESGAPLPGGGEPLSENGLFKVHVKLRQILDQAYLDGDIEKNPCHFIKFPKPPQTKERRPLDIEEARRFRREVLSGFEDEPDAKLVALAIETSTGARRGELLGLCWGDIDFDAGTVFIHTQFSNDKKLRDAKQDSRRTLAVDPELLGILREWHLVQGQGLPHINELRRARRLSPVLQDADYPVVTGRYGDRLDPNNFDRFFRNFCVDHGFGEFTKDVTEKQHGGKTLIRGKGYEGLMLHELRHTVASLLIAEGLDVKSAQHQLGHASAQTTLNIYAHAFESRSREAADMLSGIYGK